MFYVANDSFLTSKIFQHHLKKEREVTQAFALRINLSYGS